jgi:tetratricopeptide (TPR) repeat protein
MRRVLTVLAFAAAAFAVAGCSHLVILRDPLSAAEHNDLGVSYERRGEWDLAAREYRRALRVDRRFARARLNLGNVAAHEDRWAEAEKHYRRALRGLPADPDAWNNLAVALMRRRVHLIEAESLATHAVALAADGDSLYRATLAEVRAARLK